MKIDGIMFFRFYAILTSCVSLFMLTLIWYLDYSIIDEYPNHRGIVIALGLLTSVPFVSAIFASVIFLFILKTKLKNIPDKKYSFFSDMGLHNYKRTKECERKN